MPVKPLNNMKGTSPSKLVQGVVDQSWAPKGTENPKQALDQKFTKNPVSVKKG